jgi:hypothetical protein
MNETIAQQGVMTFDKPYEIRPDVYSFDISHCFCDVVVYLILFLPYFSCYTFLFL